MAENPALEGLESDAEGLIVNRLAEPHQHAIAPIDECYRLVGLVKASWEGISGGDAARARDRRLLRRAARKGGGGVSEAAPTATNGAAAPAAPGRLEFAILGVEAVRHAAAPTLHFTGHVTEPAGARSTRSR